MFLIEEAGFARCILDANGQGSSPAEVASSRPVQQNLADLALVLDVAGPNYTLEHIAWKFVGLFRQVWSVWHVNSFHEAGCLVRALTALRRSDPYFMTFAHIAVKEAQSCGRRVHEIGMRRALELLDATKDEDTRTFSPKDAAAALRNATRIFANPEGCCGGIRGCQDAAQAHRSLQP